MCNHLRNTYEYSSSHLLLAFRPFISAWCELVCFHAARLWIEQEKKRNVMIIFSITYNELSMQWSEKDSNCIIFPFVPQKNNENCKNKVGDRTTEKIFSHKLSEAFYRDIFGRKALSLNDITHVEVHKILRDWNSIQKVRLNYFLWNSFLRNVPERNFPKKTFDQEVLMAVNTEIFRFLTSKKVQTWISNWEVSWFAKLISKSSEKKISHVNQIDDSCWGLFSTDFKIELRETGKKLIFLRFLSSEFLWFLIRILTIHNLINFANLHENYRTFNPFVKRISSRW